MGQFDGPRETGEKTPLNDDSLHRMVRGTEGKEMRNISFSATKEKFRAREKHVTRRMGWDCLEFGDLLMGCEQVQGIKKGTLVRMDVIRILGSTWEPLDAIITSPYRINPPKIVEQYLRSEGGSRTKRPLRGSQS